MADREQRRLTRSTAGNSGNNEISDIGEESEQEAQPSSSAEWSHVGEVDSPSSGPNPIETETEVETEREEDDPYEESSDSNSEERIGGTMSEEKDETGTENPTMKLGDLEIPLVSVGTQNDVSTIVKPLYPKEEWTTMSPDARRKVFTQIERKIFDDSLKMYTVSATNMDALNDAVAVLNKLERLEHHFKQNDLMCVLEILKYNKNYPRDSSQYSSVNMIERLESITAQEVADSNRFIRLYVDHARAGYLELALAVTLNFMQANCDDELNAKVLEEYNQYDEEEQGGNLYLFLALSLIYHDSETECLALANTVTELKITDIPGEDVTLFVTKYRAALTFLKNANSYQDTNGVTHYKYLRADSLDLLLEKLRSTSTQEFNDLFGVASAVIKMEKLEPGRGQTRLGPGDASLLGDNLVQQLEGVLSNAQSQYLELSSLGKWHGVGTPGTSSFLSCWNCGEDGHRVPECPKEKNEAVIAANRQKFGGRGRGRGRDGGRGRGRGRTPFRWAKPTPAEHNKRLIGGKWHNFNPTANGGRGHWYVMNPQPKAATPAPAPAATPAPAPAAHPATTIVLDASSLTSGTTMTTDTTPSTSGTSVAQVSLEASRREARKQGLLATLEKDRDTYNAHMQELKDLEGK